MVFLVHIDDIEHVTGGIQGDRMDNGSDKKLCRQVLGSSIRAWWSAFVFGKNHKVRVHPLPVLLVYGLAGVLIDLDHLIIQQTQRLRPLHLEYWFIMGVVCICYNAYIYRRVHKTRMIEKKIDRRFKKDESSITL